MAKQSSMYESGLTTRAMVLAIAPVAVAIFMVWNGVYYLDKFPGADNLAWRFIFSLLPLLFGAALLGVTVFVVVKNMGRKVSLAEDGLSYCQGKESFTVRWSLAAFSIPRGKLYRTLAVTDGKHMVRIEELFFKDFDQIAKGVADFKGMRR